MSKLVLIRHGRIAVEFGKPFYRLGRRPLSPKGIEGSQSCGEKAGRVHLRSRLLFGPGPCQRNPALHSRSDRTKRPFLLKKDKALNERMYGSYKD